MSFKLPAKLTAQISDLQTELAAFAEDARTEFEDRSERWRDGDAGMAADTWIEGLADLADTLDNVEAAPES